MDKKIALITGASKGLGEALGKIFLANNFFVIALSRTPPHWNPSLWIEGDITDSATIQHTTETLFHLDRLDVLIHSAGIGLYEKIENCQKDDLKILFHLNTIAPFTLTAPLLPLLEKTQGSILFLSSVAAKISIPYMGAYCASKSALDVMITSLRAEIASRPIHILNLTIGRINTGFGSRVLGRKDSPKTLGITTPESFSEAVFYAYIKKKRALTYPYWYKGIIFLWKFYPPFFENLALKKWEKREKRPS